jgi:serine/threonine protein kinase
MLRSHKVKHAVTGLVFLHEHGIVHSNICGVRFLNHLEPCIFIQPYIQANILIDEQGAARISDAGLDFTFRTRSGYSTVPTRYRWMAPEVLLHFGDELPQPAESADIYSMGRTIEEVRRSSR